MKSMTAKDFKLDWFSGSGAGGQHRNKHQNCCRITHLETGLMATGQNSRSRQTNQREAFERLVGKLIAHYSTPEERRNISVVVRTYHFERNVATDGAVSKPVAGVMEGDIDAFLEQSLLGERKIRGTGRM